MKKLLAVAALAAAAGVANADVTFNLGSATLNGGQYFGGTFAGSGTLTGMAISYDFQPSAAALNDSWASDAILYVQGADTNTGEWGGYNLSFGGFDEGLFSFNGSISAPPGVYSDTQSVANATPPSGAGTWTLYFANGYGTSAAVTYNNVTVTLFGVNVPTPGAAALLGLGGLVAIRRRR
ncbi:MAG: hypothetical protein U0637_14705 [Phycisphaerales bacterium]